MAYDLSQLMVLVVDDSEYAHDLARVLLRPLGVRQFSFCVEGASAFERLVAFPADLMLVDWEMPGMKGIELVKRLRTDPVSPAPYLPVIMLTGHAEPARVLEARDAGVSDYLVKPISARVLCERIGALVERPRPFVRTATYFGPERVRGSGGFASLDLRKGRQG
jgi:CheY-like chemotaxis protein